MKLSELEWRFIRNRLELKKRKDHTLFQLDARYCGVCGMLLDLKKTLNEWNWCPKCHEFRWAKDIHIQSNPTKKSDPGDLWLPRSTTLLMSRKMDEYITEATKRIEKQVKTYTSEQYDQEFLKSLIPKK